jgi:hypothetical protein
MTKALSRPPATPRRLLSRILEQPELVRAVRALPARALGRVIDRVGLEDAAEIVSLATTEQLQRVFDEDLWTGRPGEEERFDPARFALWLEVMVEAGERFAARKLAELPEELVALALQRNLLVVNLDELAPAMAEAGEEAEGLEKALEGVAYLEIGEYRLMARRQEGWDALCAVLTALDEEEHDLLARLLERACRASERWVEDEGGLYAVLHGGELIEEDAAGEREARRAEEGYVAPADAAAFLKGARARPVGEIAESEPDPIARAWFRHRGKPVREEAAVDDKLLELLGDLVEEEGSRRRRLPAPA